MGSSYSVTRVCRATGCTARTHAAKPYCHQHVEHNPHAQWVLRRLAETEALEAKEQAAEAARAG